LACALACVAAGVLSSSGCGTTRSTDTLRTATEQLLVSDAIDRAVQTVDVRPLAGQTVYFDDSRLTNVVDRDYLVSTLRQHLLASGCVVKNVRKEADFIVEARAGAVGTDRNDLLFGIPATNIPQILPFQPAPAAIPEVPFAKRRDQRGIAKISMFAYHRESGLPAWQSGLAVRESSSNDVWILGAGPFQHGTIYDGPAFAGRGLDKSDASGDRRPAVDLAQEKTFASPQKLVERFRPAPVATEVVQAGHQPSLAPLAQAPQPPASATPMAAAGAPTAYPPYPSDDIARLLDTKQLRTANPPNANSQIMIRGFNTPLLRPQPTTTINGTPPLAADPIDLPHPRFNPL